MIDYVDRIIAFEQGDLTDDETVELFGHLVATGQAWHLQGAYGRMAANLIEQGFIDADGNVL